MLFSVIIPVYRGEKYLDRCIRSILSQSFQDLELILVDDGSDDRSYEIIQSYQATDGRIVGIHKDNGGPTSARKTACLAARGEYIVAVDVDDTIEADYLARFAEAIERFQPDMVCCGFTRCIGENSVACKFGIPAGFYDREEIREKVFPVLLSLLPTLWAKAFRKDIFLERQVLVPDRINIGEDGILVFSALAAAQSLAVLDTHGYRYHVNPDSALRSNKLIPYEDILFRIRFLKTHLPDDESLCKQRFVYNFRALYHMTRSMLFNMSLPEARKQIDSILRRDEVREIMADSRNAVKGKNKLRWFLLNCHMFGCMKAAYRVRRRIYKR